MFVGAGICSLLILITLIMYAVLRCVFSTPETIISGMGASFRRTDFCDRLNGQALVVIGG